MSAHPVAFVDEAFIRLHQHPGAYLFAAVLVDADDLPDVIDAARQAAGPHEEFHASDLYRRATFNPSKTCSTPPKPTPAGLSWWPKHPWASTRKPPGKRH
jgi:hypothetical protein